MYGLAFLPDVRKNAPLVVLYIVNYKQRTPFDPYLAVMAYVEENSQGILAL